MNAQCVTRYRDGTDKPVRHSSTSAHPLVSAVDLFKFIKRIVQETQEVSTDANRALIAVVPTFKRYLNAYANR